MAVTPNEPVQFLKTAVSHLTDYISNHNIPPQEALQKVAEEFDLAPHFIKRASEAINVALTHAHFKKHADARDTDFAITDADKVIENLFGEAVKTAYDKTPDTVVTGGKADNFRINLHKLTSPKYKKAYAEIINTPNDEQKMSFRGVVEKSALVLDTLEKKASEAYNEAVDAEFRLKVAFSSLVNSFSKDEINQEPWAEFEKKAFAETGEKAKPFLDLLYKAAGFTSPRAKLDYEIIDYTPDARVEKFAEVISLAENYSVLNKQAQEAKEEFAYHKNHVNETFQEFGKAKLAKLYERGDLTLLEEIIAEKQADDATEEQEKEAQEFVDPVVKKAARHVKIAQESKNLFASLAHSIDFGKDVRGAASAYNDNTKRQHILTDLLTTDPILSEADPHHIAQSYQQMIQLSPELSLQKEVVRGQLRQMAVGQALNPHDASLLAGANNEMLKMLHARAPQPQPSHNQYGDKK